MKQKNLIMISLISLFFYVTPAAAKPSYFQGDVDKVTTFNKVTDYFATIGMSDADKKKVKRQRRYQRKQQRLKKKREDSSRR